MARALALSAAAALASSCAAARFVPPSGTPAPAADGAVIWAGASETCRTAGVYGGELRVSGRVDGQRIAGLTLALAIEREGRLAIDARYAGASVFTLRGTTDAATFVETEHRRVTTGPVAALLEALVGIPLGPARLLAVLAGCVSEGGDPVDVVRIGAVLRATSPDAVTYLVRAGDAWVIRAGTFDRWEVEYPRRADSWPRQIVIRSAPAAASSANLTLNVASSDTVRRDPSVFVPVVPAGAEHVPLERLREDGPFGSRQ